MCLGIPGKIIEIYEANGLQMGKVDFGGVTKEVLSGLRARSADRQLHHRSCGLCVEHPR